MDIAPKLCRERQLIPFGCEQREVEPREAGFERQAADDQSIYGGDLGHSLDGQYYIGERQAPRRAWLLQHLRDLLERRCGVRQRTYGGLANAFEECDRSLVASDITPQ